MEFVNYMKTRLVNVESIDENEMVSFGLIQTLGHCIYFVYDGKKV